MPTSLLTAHPDHWAPDIAHNDATRRQFLGLLAAAGLLTACGSEDMPTDSRQDTRTISHALGTTEVPVSVERVVALTGTEELDALVALGVSPVAAAELESGQGFSPTAAPLLSDGVTMLGTRREVDLEAVIGQRPDLILGTEGWLGDFYDQLTTIAPTVAIDSGGSAAEITRKVAEALGMVDRAEELVAESDARIDDLATRLDGSLDGLTYTLVKPFPGDGEYVLYQLTDVDGLLQRLGMVRPQVQLDLFAEQGAQASVSLERADVLDTDVVLLFGYDDPEDDAAISQTLADPLFSRLAAPARGTTFSVDSAFWYFSSLLALPSVVDDLEQRIIPTTLELT